MTTVQEVRALIARKDEIEAEIASLAGSLEGPGGPGLHGNLIDRDGFPRADIDVLAVRQARHRIACT